MALPKYLTEIETNGSGMSDSSVSRRSIDSISAIAATKTSSVFAGIHDRRADHHAHGVQVVGRARHQVAGAVRLEIRERQRLQVREEVVAHVVLDVPRRADQDAAHEEPEHAADQADGEQQAAVLHQLGAGDAAGQIVDRVAEHPRRATGDAGRDDDAGEAEQEVAAVAENVAQQPAGGSHVSSIRGRIQRV